MIDTAQTDWFPETITGPDAVTLRALSRGEIITMIAAARLVGMINPFLRGDGQSAGHSTIVDAIPVIFPVGIDHKIRQPIAALARLVEKPELLASVEHLVSQDEIQMEVRRLSAGAAHNFSVAAKLFGTISQEGLA